MLPPRRSAQASRQRGSIGTVLGEARLAPSGDAFHPTRFRSWLSARCLPGARSLAVLYDANLATGSALLAVAQGVLGDQHPLKLAGALADLEHLRLLEVP